MEIKKGLRYRVLFILIILYSLQCPVCSMDLFERTFKRFWYQFDEIQRTQRMSLEGSNRGRQRWIVLTYFYCVEILSLSTYCQILKSSFSDIYFRVSLQTPFKYHFTLCSCTSSPPRRHLHLLIP